MIRNGTNATPPASKDGVFNCSELLQLTVDSGAPSRMARSSTVHCQLELQGTVENRSLLAGGVAFYILWCWKDDHLQTSEYSLQDKYKGEVTNTTENGFTSLLWRPARSPPTARLFTWRYTALYYCRERKIGLTKSFPVMTRLIIYRKIQPRKQ